MTAHSDAGVVRAVHQYGRARSQSDYLLERVDVPPSEARRRVARTAAAWDRVAERIAAQLNAAGADVTVPVVAALAAVGAQLWHYGTMRQEGASAVVAVDVLDAIDELLSAARASAPGDGV